MTTLKSDTRNLNIKEDLPDEVWQKVPLIYQQMPGWKGFGNHDHGEYGIPYWFSFDQSEMCISASLEPSGLQFFATHIEADVWESWLTQFKTRATEILKFKVGERETNEVDDHIEWL